MPNTICLDKNHSTTRLLTQEKPIMENRPLDKFETVLFLTEGKNRKGEGGLRTKGYFKKSYDDKPMISIITVVFNGEKYLEQTIQSVINQTYDNVEYILIDGGSTDGTVDIIKKYGAQIDYWISESDSGIYDAWNKGISLATGDIIGFCNADDFYEQTTLVKIVAEFKENTFQITYGNTQFIENESCVGMNRGHFQKDTIYRGFGFMHTTVFSTKLVYHTIGKFDTSYRIAGDTDWLLRAFKEDVKFTKCDNLTYMRTGGVSQEYDKNAFSEFTKSLELHGFNRNKILLAKLRISIFYFIRDLIGFKNIMFIRFQIINIIIYIFNFIYNYLPFFKMKQFFLRRFNMKLGKNSFIHTPVKFFTIGKLNIGKNTAISPNCYLDNRGSITIGNNVSISHCTKIYTAGHQIINPCFSFFSKPVNIEDNVVIFTNVLIMPGVTVHKNAVVLPGSVVTKDVKENCVVGGNPAKVVQMRNIEINYKIDHGLWFVT